jgi:glycosyltransferase involved in cell wall biosynthesis
MEGHPRGLGQATGDFTLEAIGALRALGASGQQPFLIGYHPVARMNPYQAVLYREVWRSGAAALPIIREPRIGELAELAKAGWPSVLHLHWLNQIIGHAGSVAEAKGMRRTFLRRIDAYLGAGGRLAWTVHNIIPHGARFEAEEAELSAEVVARSDVIHIMADGTPDLVRDWFAIPAEKVLRVPHPSYLGAYEDIVTREQARHELGLWPDEIVHLVFGALKPYKGLAELLDAWDVLAKDGRPRRLVIAGAPGEEPGIAEIVERAALNPSVLIHPRRIPPQDVQVFLRAADVAVLPYLRSLNSGSLMLALTFGVPVVVPAGGGLATVVDERVARAFAPDRPDTLLAALRASDELLTAEARVAARSIAERLAPGPLSETFVRGLRSRLGSPLVEPVGGATGAVAG